MSRSRLERKVRPRSVSRKPVAQKSTPGPICVLPVRPIRFADFIVSLRFQAKALVISMIDPAAPLIQCPGLARPRSVVEAFRPRP